MPSPSPVPTAFVALEAYDTLQPEDNSDLVATLQSRLMELGYFDYDEITTYYGSVTKSAVKLFQRAQGLEETGVSDSETQRLLYAECPTLPHEARRQGIRRAQHASAPGGAWLL
jgi:peptidoglycan hydrolase-like protein with peptidoglycan-binding domain